MIGGEPESGKQTGGDGKKERKLMGRRQAEEVKLVGRGKQVEEVGGRQGEEANWWGGIDKDRR